MNPNRGGVHLRRGVMSGAVALLFVVVAGACGSGDDDAQPTSTSRPAGTAASRSPGSTAAAGTRTPGETATPESTAPPAGSPSATHTATFTPTPTPSPSPTASPTPAALTFEQPDGWDGTMSPPSTGPFGAVYAQSNIGYYIATPNRLHVWAAVNVGVNERPAATAWLYNRFTAPGEGAAPVTARISTGANWKGVLAGNGAAGTRAGVTITLSVLEDGKVLATKPVHALEQRESVLTVGGFRDAGRKDVEMEVSLLPGHEYELRLTATCEAVSGAIGVATSCVYGAKATLTDGYVDWGLRTIVFVR
ncbi:MAG: hypothetical protein HY873_11315 [Chloroflexi bacterium]|nr:hypothetical protein [Chloroflexota bacterium]